MKKILAAVLMTCALAANANAFYISGSAGSVSGEDDYQGTNLNLLLGLENLAIEPSWKSYGNKYTETYNTYGLRAAWETDLYTAGVYGGLTPKKAYIKALPNEEYSNQFVGADFTISLNPLGNTHSRLVGPGNRGISVGGEGITRVDVGAGIKYTEHKTEISDPSSEAKTGQTEYQLFAGAQVLMLNVSAGMSYFDYNDKDSATFGFITGVNYAYDKRPDSAFNLKVDVPFFPIVTPYVGYSKVKYDVSVGSDHSNNYELGAYLDFAMLTANVSYQLRDEDGHHDGFLSAGIGLKFE